MFGKEGWLGYLYETQGLLGTYFLGPSDDLPGSILGPFQDLRATVGHLLVAPAWPVQAFPGTFRGPFRNGQKNQKWPGNGSNSIRLGRYRFHTNPTGMRDLFPGSKGLGGAI